MKRFATAYALERQAERGPDVPELEMRRFERLDLTRQIRVTPVAGTSAPLQKRLTRWCQGVDISQGGLGLVWTGGPPPEWLVVELPEDGCTGSILAATRWSRQLARGLFDLGVEFVSYYPAPRAALSGEFKLSQEVVRRMAGVKPLAESCNAELLDMASFTA